jgi:hypothetical protein
VLLVVLQHSGPKNYHVGLVVAVTSARLPLAALRDSHGRHHTRAAMSIPEPADDLPTWVNPLRVPCFRQTMLHALGGSTFMGAHGCHALIHKAALRSALTRWSTCHHAGCWRFYKSRSHAQATNTGVKCFVFLGITSWCVPHAPAVPLRAAPRAAPPRRTAASAPAPARD